MRIPAWKSKPPPPFPMDPIPELNPDTVSLDGLHVIEAGAGTGKTYNITYVNPMGYKRNSIKFNCKLEKPK